MKVQAHWSKENIFNAIDDDGFVDYSKLTFDEGPQLTTIEGPAAIIGCLMEALAEQEVDLDKVFA